MYYYEYVHGNNSPASRLRLIGDEDEFEREKRLRRGEGHSFFELEIVTKDLGETVQKRDLNGYRVGDKRIPRRGRL